MREEAVKPEVEPEPGREQHYPERDNGVRWPAINRGHNHCCRSTDDWGEFGRPAALRWRDRFVDYVNALSLFHSHPKV
jgi:hypothetical protein